MSQVAPYIAVILLLLALLWFFMGVLHELGHALAALLLFRGPVTVYLGTYGQSTGHWHFRLGRLQVHLAHNLFLWRGGYCECQGANPEPWRQGIFIAAGPLFPVLLTGIATQISFAHSIYPLRALAVILLVMAVIGAFFNLLPHHKPVFLNEASRPTYNDGQLLKNQWGSVQLTRKVRAKFLEAEYHRLTGKYVESAAIYAEILPLLVPDSSIMRPAFYVLTDAGRYDEALALSEQFQEKFEDAFTDDDRFTHALVLSRLGQHWAAIEAYTTLIEQPQPYLMAYNNRGYTYNLLGEYELALADFTHTIAHDAAHAYAHNNRGLAQLKLGQEAAGLADIRHGLQLDPANAYGYRNLGIYHLGRSEYSAAMVQFELARQLDPTTHDLDTYIQQARQHLEQGSDTDGQA